MRRFPHGGEVLGASPANPLLAPVLRYEMVLSRQQALIDLQAIQRIPGLAGYWPADPAYLFEDSSGTIPANTNGTGVVGYVKNVAAQYLSGNLLNNYDFTSDLSGWTLTQNLPTRGVITWVNGALRIAGDGSWFPNVAKNVLTVGYCYEVTIVVKEISGSGIYRVQLGGSTLSNLPNAPGTYTYQGVADATGFQILSYMSGYVDIDSVSVRRISALPATQTTTNKKPILKRTPTSNVYWLNSDADDELTATLGNLGSACTVAKAGAEGVTFTEGVTISSTYNIAPAYGFNGDVAIFNRALTTTEKALLTRYMSRGVPVLGSELVTNGGFDSADNWTLGNATGTLDITGGALTLTNTSEGGYVRAVNSVPFTIAATDYIYVAATRIPGAFFAANAAAGFNIDGSGAAFATPASYVSSFSAVKVVSGGTPRAIVVVQTSTIGATASFSSVSMRKIS